MVIFFDEMQNGHNLKSEFVYCPEDSEWKTF